MKGLTIALAMMIGIGTSQASTTLTGNVNLNPVSTSSPAKIATKKDPVLAKSTRIPKPKLFRSNPHRATHFSVAEDPDDDIFVQDEDIFVGYRREDISKPKAPSTPDDPEGIITEDIRWRLFLARTAAMIRYHQIHG